MSNFKKYTSKARSYSSSAKDSGIDLTKIIIVGVLIFVLRGTVKDLFDSLGNIIGFGKDESEEQAENAIKEMVIDRTKLTITDNEADQRVTNILYAMSGLNQDETLCAQQFVKKGYEYIFDEGHISKQNSSGFQWWNPTNSAGFSSGSQTGLYSDYVRNPQAHLSKADRELIAQRFGVKRSITDHLTLTNYIANRDSGDLWKMIKSVYRSTQIKV